MIVFYSKAQMPSKQWKLIGVLMFSLPAEFFRRGRGGGRELRCEKTADMTHGHRVGGGEGYRRQELDVESNKFSFSTALKMAEKPFCL